MGNGINYISIELDRMHKDFDRLVPLLFKKGFSFRCYNKWTLHSVDFDPQRNVIDIPNPSVTYTCTLNANSFSEEIVLLVLQNDFAHGGCIRQFVIGVKE